MTRSGLAEALYLDGYDLSGDVDSVQQCAATRRLQTMTRMDSDAVARIAGRSTGRLVFHTWFNDAGGGAHDALKGLPSNDVLCLYGVGPALGDAVACLRAKQVAYGWVRATNGALLGQAQAVSTGGVPLEWGTLLLPQTTHAAATTGVSLDHGAPTSHGLMAQLQLIDVDSGTVAATIEHSANGTTWSTLVNFASASGRSAERVTVSGAIDRHLRVVTSGTFSDAKLAVAVRRGTAQDDQPY